MLTRALAAPRGRPSFEARTQPSLRRLRRRARGARASDDGHDWCRWLSLGQQSGRMNTRWARAFDPSSEIVVKGATSNPRFVTILPNNSFHARFRKEGEKCRTISPDSASVRRSGTRDSTSATSTHSSRPRTRSRTVIILNANPNCGRAPSRRHLSPQHRQRRRLPDGHRVQLCVLEATERQADGQRIHGEGRGVPLAGSGRDEDHRRRRGLLRPQAEHRQGRQLLRFSPAAAATRSSSTSTESRTCSIPGASGTSPSLISAASRPGPAWIRIRKRTCFRR